MTRTDWLSQMCLRFEHDPHGFVLELYRGQVAALLAAGVNGLDADRIALRQAQLQFFQMTGYTLREAGELVGVSERTAKADAAHVRETWDATRLLFGGFGWRLPRVSESVRSAARVSPTVPPARVLRGRR
jgi:hypothetical protein